MAWRWQSLVVVLVVCAAAAGEEPETAPPLQDAAPVILKDLGLGQLRDAILMTEAYEAALRTRYAPPTLQDGTFSSTGDHLSFQVAFKDWKQVDTRNHHAPPWLPAGVRNCLLALDGPDAQDHFCVLALDQELIDRSVGVAPPSAAPMSDREVMLNAEPIVGLLGSVRQQQFETIGNHRGLALRIDRRAPDPSAAVFCVPSHRTMLFFVVSSSPTRGAENEQAFVATIKSADLDFKPADDARIQAIHAGLNNPQNPVQVLNCVEKLSDAGEYNTAAHDLTSLRAALTALIPPPRVEGATATDAAYGITLTNPDPQRWKLQAQVKGSVRMITLEDTHSVKNEAMMVLVTDMALLVGPEVAHQMEDQAGLKQMLITSGRGALSRVGEVEAEHMTTFKGMMAYDGQARASSGLKTRILMFGRRGCVISLLMVATAADYDQQMKDYAAVARDGLKIQ